MRAPACGESSTRRIEWGRRQATGRLAGFVGEREWGLVCPDVAYEHVCRAGSQAAGASSGRLHGGWGVKKNKKKFVFGRSVPNNLDVLQKVNMILGLHNVKLATDRLWQTRQWSQATLFNAYMAN